MFVVKIQRDERETLQQRNRSHTGDGPIVVQGAMGDVKPIGTGLAGQRRKGQTFVPLVLAQYVNLREFVDETQTGCHPPKDLLHF